MWIGHLFPTIDPMHLLEFDKEINLMRALPNQLVDETQCSICLNCWDYPCGFDFWVWDRPICIEYV